MKSRGFKMALFLVFATVGWISVVECLAADAGASYGQSIQERVRMILEIDGRKEKVFDRLAGIRDYEVERIEENGLMIEVKGREQGRFSDSCLLRSIDGKNRMLAVTGEICRAPAYSIHSVQNKEWTKSFSVLEKVQVMPLSQGAKLPVLERPIESFSSAQLDCVIQQAKVLDSVRKRPELADYFKNLNDWRSVRFKLVDHSRLMSSDQADLDAFKTRRAPTLSMAADEAVNASANTIYVSLGTGMKCETVDESRVVAALLLDMNRIVQRRQENQLKAQLGEISGIPSSKDLTKDGRDLRQVDRREKSRAAQPQVVLPAAAAGASASASFD